MEDVRPTSLLELGTINSVMRLMSTDGGEMPIVKYRHNKENIELWYREMESVGLNSEEIEILESYLKPTYGMCITQEQLMMMVQDPRISSFTFLESDKARKILAKKKLDQVEGLENKFYRKGLESGARKEFLKYIWEYLFAVQMGYSLNEGDVA